MLLRTVLCCLVFAWASCSGGASSKAELHIAVASNFQAAAKKLALAFEERNDCKVLLSAGSTGKHYAQIVNGAPFDLFFAADAERPQLLAEQGVGIADSRFTYAVGRLVLWTANAEADLSSGLSARNSSGDKQNKVPPESAGEQSWPGLTVRHFAIANPKAAPYGKAAQQLMEELGVWQAWQPKLVRGENIGQAFQFVQSGSAEIGLVAASQIVDAGGSSWVPSADLYQAIEQQAIQLTMRAEAANFLSFVRSADGRKIIADSGYHLPLP